MLHTTPNESSCKLYKKSDCEKSSTNLVCVHALAIAIKSLQCDHLSLNGYKKRVRRLHNIQEQLW